MKFGVADYGMNVWDGGRYCTEMRLEEIRSVGYDGLERLTAVTEAEAVRRAAVFRRLGMEFLTCEAADPETGMVWTAAFGREYVWLEPGELSRNVPFDVFCRRANKFVAAAARYGIRAGLHNHLGLRVESQRELEDFLKACPGAMLLLDVGHLHAAGGDCVEIIRKYGSRLCAVHFKDVELTNPDIGLDRWYERLRFCELGGGNCGLDYGAMARELLRQGYDKWMLVEHDTHTDEPVRQLKASLEVLKNALA